MLNRKCGRTTLRKWLISALAVILVFNLLGCEQPELPEASLPIISVSQPTTEMAEVSPPKAIQMLHPPLDVHQPQVTILSPQPDELLQDNTINVQLQVQDLPIFRDETLGLGPHLQAILDNQPLEDIYTLDQPLILSDLEAGTHTLRIFAAYPWGESFKNEGAYAQTTFHIFTKTPENNPNPQLPLLTYNQPRGTYGAEPVLLDFYLANAPLHLVAQENPEDEIVDWRIRVTVNSQSFIIDQWQPIYIKGIKPGKNWVQLEYLDELGEPLTNVYNNTARVFTYDPNSQDTLSKLVRGELTIAQARPIVDRGYEGKIITPEPQITPTLEEIPEILEPVETPEEVEIVPSTEETPETLEPVGTPEEIEIVPSTEEIPETLEPVETPEELETPETLEPVEPLTLEEKTDDIETIPEIDIPLTLNETSETPVEEVLPSEELEQLLSSETKPETEPTPQTNGWFDRIKGQIQQLPVFDRGNSQTSPSIPASQTAEPSETDNLFQRIFSRFQQNPSEPEPSQTLPEIVEEVPMAEPSQPVLESEKSLELLPDEFQPTPEQINIDTSVVEPEVETSADILDETSTEEPQTPLEEPIIIQPEPEPEPLPEIVDETSILDLETQLEEPVEVEPEPEMMDETPIEDLETQLEEPMEVEPEPEMMDETSIEDLETDRENS
ncbi:hypothetical protein VB834_06460 [Limnoraphis robusta Tam1]|uniref:hypothetical protein n=1 Tax=Limnoraphis robusta TaxID=1118279 RepID=UPI002B2055D9|nr:hypothetical protein [Limnoraphis robusta]MEA5499823.1 hypothetical protein [Limnoraphis robusta BA-68 BA1]MEA5538671.1 hypothetical protein [Limnoraphis robusta Tam1]